MNNQPLISVIVPVYNVEKHLEKCLDSIINQTYKNLEIIIVNDGSTDNSGDTCRKYAEADNRIKLIEKENGGLCSARNAGLKTAAGDLIGFVDSDDYCAEDMYEYLLEGMEKYNAQVSVCRYYRVKQDGSVRVNECEDMFFSDHDSMMKEFIEHFVIRSTFWNKLFDRRLFEGKEFPEGKTYEGTYFMHEVLEDVERLVSLGKPKYYYLDNEGSIVNTRSLNNLTDYAFSYIKRYYDLEASYPDLRTKLFDDAVKAVRALSYVGYRSTEQEIESRKTDLEKIGGFLEDNRDLVEKLSQSVQKELHCLSLTTLEGYKRAKLIRSVSNKIYKLLGKLTFGKIKERSALTKKSGKPNYYRQAPEMTPENQETLRRLQCGITEIIDEIDRICTKHGLRYYLYGGTLLGAVRHKGFIPWDDDADLVMPREDYEKFREICKTELGKDYFYQTGYTDKNFPMLYTKIRKNGTYVHEDGWAEKELHHGIFADILPLDHFPKNRFIGKLVLHAVSITHQICALDSCASGNPAARVVFKIGKKLPKTFNYRVRDFILKTTNRLSSKENICSFGSHYQPMIRRVFKTDWFFGEEIRMEFEGRQFRVPTDWEKYILHLFGEKYMELPPEEMRVCHTDFNKINFNGDTPKEK